MTSYCLKSKRRAYHNKNRKKYDIEFIMLDDFLAIGNTVNLYNIKDEIFTNRSCYEISKNVLVSCFDFGISLGTGYTFVNINYKNLMLKIKNKTILFNPNKKTLLFKKHMLQVPKTIFTNDNIFIRKNILIKFTTLGWIKLLKWFMSAEENMLKLKENYKKLYAEVHVYKIE